MTLRKRIGGALIRVFVEGGEITANLAADSALSVANDPLEIAQGNVDGISSLFKFGQNPSVGTSYETVWSEGGVYSWPNTPTVMTVSSSSTSDDEGDVGAETIFIQGLDSDYNLSSEMVTLNGQSGVNTVNTYLRVFRAYVISVGSTGWNVGNIFIGTGAISGGKPANVYARIDAIEGQTQTTTYTVPAGKTLYIAGVNAFAGEGKQATFRIRFRLLGESWRSGPQPYLYQQAFRQEFEYFSVLPEKSDIEIQALVSATTGAASATIEGVLIDNLI